MKISVKYYEILEEDLRGELDWLKEEFNILFKSKMENYTNKDKRIANDILDYIIENIYVYDNMILQTLFTEAMENIEKMHPDLF
ncbi:MAG: hypothetical protein ACFFB0_13560 [Promethearchaeota archaeon]